MTASMPRWPRRGLAFVLAALLAGCAAPRPTYEPAPDGCRVPTTPDATPLLRLLPAALGRTLAVQQQLTVTAKDQTRRIDVMLEVDDAAVRMALLSLGQTAARLVWDGKRLDETRSPWLPAAVSGERILSDLQLALWPADAVRDALPVGWFLDADDAQRVLRFHRTTVATVAYPTPTRIELVQQRDGYQLVIESRTVP